jgi:uncharacterized SAM-binding protein YcdF (DUF218 family)
MTAHPPASRRSWLKWIVVAIVVGLLLFYLLTCLRIVRQSALDEARSADAIVVFGAAEYYGKPSPVFRARLDHAFDLFQQNLAPMVITTGGSGKEVRFSEGGVGRDYLASKGIGDRHLIAETQGDNSAESAERVAHIMRTNGMTSCIAVSDSYHLFRIKRLLQSYGLTVYTSPRPEFAPKSRWQRWQSVLREALSYVLWRLHVT